MSCKVQIFTRLTPKGEKGINMTIAIWLIVIIEAVRAAQNFMQLMMARRQTRLNVRATDEFIQSLKKSDREFVREMLEAYERQESEVEK